MTLNDIQAALAARAADPALTAVQHLQARAASMCLDGDLAAASQAIEACKIPAADWAAAQAGTLDY